MEARQTSKEQQRRQDLCWKVHDRAQSFVLRSYTMHDNVTKTFLLVSSSVSSKQLLCFVHGQGQKREQKPRTKNFVEFHNHSPLLTMLRVTASFDGEIRARFSMANKFTAIGIYNRLVCRWPDQQLYSIAAHLYSFRAFSVQ